MKILITGDRRWNDGGLIKEILDLYDKDKVTICYYIKPGASLLAKVTAEHNGFKTEIVDSLDGIDYLVIFHKYIRGSVESKKLIKDASNAGIPYQIVGSSF